MDVKDTPLRGELNRHYVDGWVMWPPAVFRLLTGVLGLVAVT